MELMGKTSQKAPAARQLELMIRRFEGLSTLPAVAAGLLSRLSGLPASASAVAEIIQLDAALTAKVLTAAHDHKVAFVKAKPCVAEVLDKLPASVVRGIALSAKVFQAPGIGPNAEKASLLARKQLALHGLAVACCARDIAKLVLPTGDGFLAYSAGLLHDIGKQMLDETMPKSFERLVAEAKRQNASICGIEQKHLGLDHTIIGKRLAEKWHLPGEIVLAAWLHHSDTEIISEDLPQIRIAQIVQLADLIARSCDIGDSGSYDPPDRAIDTIARQFSLSTQQIDQIRRNLPKEVDERTKILGLELPGTAAQYCNALYETAVRLAGQSNKLSAENRRLAVGSAHFDFITGFLAEIEACTSGIDAATNFARHWQKFYQTGPVCVYVGDLAGQGIVEAAVVGQLGRTETIFLSTPAETSAIPPELQDEFQVVSAYEHAGWLFEQMEVDFDSTRTKIAPLLAAGRAVGAIVFELRYPVAADQQRVSFGPAASVGAAVIALALACEQERHLCEGFAQLPGRLRQRHESLVQARSLSSLAEMAAGAGHELNSAIAVISGRVQLLGQGQADPEKKRMLKQIRQRSEQISEIIADLMDFAEPTQPAPQQTRPTALLDAAIKQAVEKCNVPRLEVQMENIEALKDVFVDSPQIISAIANVLCNAVQSYQSGRGPVKLTGGYERDYVKLQITDFGCGMDADVLHKAVHPFFSAKPAGRSRGMGLAHAHRLIHLNKGSLHLASRPGEGTTVTILLPCR